MSQSNSAMQGGFLRVISGADTEAQQLTARAEANTSPKVLDDQQSMGLQRWITNQFWIMQRHRSTVQGWNTRLLKAMRVFNGAYDPEKLIAIKSFGGSDVYARIIAVKCRGAASLLRDVYLGSDRPWGIAPTPTPSIPDTDLTAIQNRVRAEIAQVLMMNKNVTPEDIADRMTELKTEALAKAEQQASDDAKMAEDRIDTMLDEGGFYEALAEFIVDLPLFPFAVLKGPVVRMVEDIRWKNGKLQQVTFPRMFWMRVSPFDLFFTPGVSRIEDADIIEHQRLTRGDLNKLIGVPGFDDDMIREVLEVYGRGGLANWMIDPTDNERAVSERRENPSMNESRVIDCLEFNGLVQGRMLLEHGFKPEQVPDPLLDYYVQAWMIGRYIIKCQIVPSPRKRHPYFVTSFEKVPGTIVGNALPDILEDVQEVCNAAIRNLVNNMSIASGPQVVINDTMMTNTNDSDDLYPWKRWHTQSDPVAPSQGSQVPVSFFNPQDNSQQLLMVYQAFSTMADDLSGIPKYITGNSLAGGAGRTASGLSMLMQQANKILQTVAANIDRDIMRPMLNALYDLIMLTDTTGLLRGDEDIKVMGVQVAVQKETQRQRQIEFLQATANPVDTQIMGIEGRANVLRAVSDTIGLQGEKIVPSQFEIRQKEAMQKQLQAAATVPPQPGAPGPQGDQGPPGPLAQQPAGLPPQPQGMNLVSPGAAGTAQTGGTG
jgi:hypothetical protein